MARLVGEGWSNQDHERSFRAKAQEWIVGAAATGFTIEVPQTAIDDLHNGLREFLGKHFPDEPDGGELARLHPPDRPFPGGTELIAA